MTVGIRCSIPKMLIQIFPLISYRKVESKLFFCNAIISLPLSSSSPLILLFYFPVEWFSLNESRCSLYYLYSMIYSEGSFLLSITNSVQVRWTNSHCALLSWYLISSCIIFLWYWSFIRVRSISVVVHNNMHHGYIECTGCYLLRLSILSIVRDSHCTNDRNRICVSLYYIISHSYSHFLLLTSPLSTFPSTFWLVSVYYSS